MARPATVTPEFSVGSFNEVWIPKMADKKVALDFVEYASYPIHVFTAIATDVLNLYQKGAESDKGSLTFRRLYKLLWYYFRGFSYCMSNYSTMDKAPRFLKALKIMGGHLKDLRTQMEALWRFGDPGDTKDPKKFGQLLGDGLDQKQTIPREQVMELLVQAAARGIGLASQSRNMGAVRGYMLKLSVGKALMATAQGSRAVGGVGVGMPRVTFVCLSHRNLVTACSADEWSDLLGGLKHAIRDARAKRIPRNSDQAKAAMARFKAVVSILPMSKGTRYQQFAWSDSMRKKQGSLIDYNEVIEAMYDNNVLNPTGNATIKEAIDRLSNLEKELASNFGINHNEEIGRSFFTLSDEAEFFQPTSRCWKCRFAFRYNTSDMSVGIESPRQTAFYANDSGNCAEDLANEICNTYGRSESGALSKEILFAV